jgi:hypothetical protein
LLFGLALGTGVLTATTSVGFFVLCAWLTTTSVAPILLGTFAFAAARSVAPIAVAFETRGVTARSAAADRVAAVSEKWATSLERVALIAFAVIALAGI